MSADSGDAGSNGCAGSVLPSTTGTKRSEMSCAGPVCPACPPAAPPPVSAATIRSAGIVLQLRRHRPADAEPREQQLRGLDGALAASSPVTAVSASVLMMIARWNSPFAAGNAGQHRGLPAAARLPEDRDVPGIAAELRDVVAHPLERRARDRAGRGWLRRANRSPVAGSPASHR